MLNNIYLEGLQFTALKNEEEDIIDELQLVLESLIEVDDQDLRERVCEVIALVIFTLHSDFMVVFAFLEPGAWEFGILATNCSHVNQI